MALGLTFARDEHAHSSGSIFSYDVCLRPDEVAVISRPFRFTAILINRNVIFLAKAGAWMPQTCVFFGLFIESELP